MSAVAEAEFLILCREAGLPAFHVSCAWLHILGQTPHQIARELAPAFPVALARKHVNRRLRRLAFDVREAQDATAIVLGKRYPELWRAGEDFARNLVACVANRGSYDERPPGVSGVASAQEAKRFQGSRVITGSDQRLRQSPASCLKLWGREQLNPLHTS
jgi:hypothetical protein